MFHRPFEYHAYVPIKIESDNKNCNICYSDYLEKRSSGFRNNVWNKRWVIISGSFLIWYKHSKYQGEFPIFSLKCQGCFPLQGALISPAGKHGNYFHFDISHSSNISDILSFRSDSLKSIETWMKILADRSKVEWIHFSPKISFTSKSIKNLESILSATKAAGDNVKEEFLDAKWAITEAQERIIKRFKLARLNSKNLSKWEMNIVSNESALVEVKRRVTITKNLLHTKWTHLLQNSQELLRRAKSIERFCSNQSKNDHTAENQRALFRTLCNSISIEEEVDSIRLTLLSYSDTHNWLIAPN